MISELDNCLEELSGLGDQILDQAEAMLLSNSGRQYPFDILAASALNRALSLTSGYVLLVKSNNFICAAHLVRLHLDNYIRLNAARLVDNPHEFALKVINGTKISDLKDSKGKNLTDTYLVKFLLDNHPSIKADYERTSDYVHLSRRHFLSSTRLVPENPELFEGIISKEDKFISVHIKITETKLMINVTRSLCKLIDSYTQRNNNL